MPPTIDYSEHVKLLLRLLPLVARHDCFALKGGAAINLFHRDLPRLPVGIDLAYLPIADRDSSLKAIDSALESLISDCAVELPRCHLRAVNIKASKYRNRLSVILDNTVVNMEVNPVLRGTLYPPKPMTAVMPVQELFGQASMTTLVFEELYADCLCKALVRQHPRDLFDARILLLNEGLSEQLKNVFIVYMLATNRPIVEVLNPMLINIRPLYRKEFKGSANLPITLPELIETRQRLIKTVMDSLTEKDRHFLVGVKRGDADWNGFAFPEARFMAGVSWKLKNLALMNRRKRAMLVGELEALLFP